MKNRAFWGSPVPKVVVEAWKGGLSRAVESYVLLIRVVQINFIMRRKKVDSLHLKEKSVKDSLPVLKR